MLHEILRLKLAQTILNCCFICVVSQKHQSRIFANAVLFGRTNAHAIASKHAGYGMQYTGLVGNFKTDHVFAIHRTHLFQLRLFK